MKRLILLFYCLMPITILAAARPSPLPESRLTGTLHGEGQTITNVANVVTSNGVSLVGLSNSKADATALATTSNTLAQAIALKADTSALSTTSNTLAQATALKANTSDLSATSNALAQASALKQDASTAATDAELAAAIAGVELGSGLTENVTILAGETITLVFSNGLYYGVFDTGEVVEISSFLPEFAVLEPTNGYPLAFLDFDIVLSNYTPSAQAPVVYEHTKIADSGDVIVLTGSGFDTNTVYVFYGATTNTAPATNTLALTAGIVVPSSMPVGDMYLMWPTNDYGFGSPIAINRTEYWWSVPSTLDTNETLYVHGQNLEIGDDSLTHLYIDGHGWVSNNTANPYMAEFTMPSLSYGMHTGYVHNGHGERYGWSDPFTFEIAPKIQWTNTTINITDAPYGADTNGVVACDAAIKAASAACAQWGTIYFPEGTYLVTNYINLAFSTRDNDHRWLGDGPELSIIYFPTNFTTSSSQGIYMLANNFQFESLGFECDYAGGGVRLLYIPNNSENVVITNCLFVGTNCVPDNEVATIVTTNLKVYDSTFIATRGPAFPNGPGIIKGNTFVVNKEGTRALGINESYNKHISGNIFRPLDVSNDVDYTGWAMGRCTVATGGAQNIYIGDNIASNMAPRWSNYLNHYGGIPLGDETATASTTSPNTVTVPAVTNGFDKGAHAEYVYGTNIYMLASNDTFMVTAGTGTSGRTYTITNVDTNTGVISISADWHETAGAPGAGSTITFNSVEPKQGYLNAGEQFLFEGQTTRFRGAPLSVSSNSITISDTSNDYTRQVATIVFGAGFGQSRRIDSGINGLMVFESAWDVYPTTASIVAIGKYAYHVAIYNNDQDGFYNITTPYGTGYVPLTSTNVNPSASIASRPWSFYGAALNCVVANNRIKDLTDFGDFWAMVDNTALAGGNDVVCPSYFNIAFGNSATNSRGGFDMHLGHFSGDIGRAYTPDVLTVGTIWRDNHAWNVRGGPSYEITLTDDMTNSTSSLLGMLVYDGNSATNGTNNTLVIDTMLGSNTLVIIGNWEEPVQEPPTTETNTYFVTTWLTTTSPQNIILPTSGTGYDATAVWYNSSGTPILTNTLSDADMSGKTNSIPTAGTYICKISGMFPRFKFINSGSKSLLRSVDNMGYVGWVADGLSSGFYGCNNLTNFTVGYSDVQDVVTSVSTMFRGCTSLVSINDAAVFTNAASHSAMFQGCTSLAQVPDLSGHTKASNISDLYRDCTAITNVVVPSSVNFLTSAADMLTGADNVSTDSIDYVLNTFSASLQANSGKPASIALGLGNNTYSTAATNSFSYLTNRTWTITSGGLE